MDTLHKLKRILSNICRMGEKNECVCFCLSHRGPELWPGGWHRDRRLAGVGHCHRRGDRRHQEDGQILVSISCLLQLESDSCVDVWWVDSSPLWPPKKQQKKKKPVERSNVSGVK